MGAWSRWRALFVLPLDFRGAVRDGVQLRHECEDGRTVGHLAEADTVAVLNIFDAATNEGANSRGHIGRDKNASARRFDYHAGPLFARE